MNRSLARLVWSRAVGRCEYCRIPEEFHFDGFQIDHVIALQHGGRTVAANLALACSRCNRHKGPNVFGINPTTGRSVHLFHPRKDRWSAHFAWDGPILIGRTPKGRATIQILAMNDPAVILVRELLIENGVFP